MDDPITVIKRAQYNFYAHHRDQGVSVERMALHFPAYAKYEAQYQAEQQRKLEGK